MIMPAQDTDHESIRQVLQLCALSEEQLRACIEWIVRMILKSDRYEKNHIAAKA